MDVIGAASHGKMLAMTDAWGTVIAAVIAGAFALGGAYLGHRAGKRQTTDQATVEHRQWLRGQRQEAYAQFLSAWEKAMTDYVVFDDEEDRWFHIPDDEDPSYYYEVFSQAANRPINELRPFLERVKILGPDSVESAAEDLYRLLTVMREALWKGFAGGVDWPGHRRALARKDFQRDFFVQKAREVIRATPRPEDE